MQGLLWIALLSVTLVSACPWANAQDPSVVGQFSPLMEWYYNPTHAVLLPNGKVLWWPSFSNGDTPRIWDPATNVITHVTPAGYNIFCAGLSLLENGQVLLTGGESGTAAALVGVANASLYDPVSGNWTALPNMNAGRFYPTNTVLPNGDVVVLEGEINPQLGPDTLPQVWQVSSGTWRDLTTAQLLLPNYPEMYLAPNGTLFYAGPTTTSRYLNTTGTGSWTIGPTMEYGSRDYGPSVMYDNGKIMVAGGGTPTATAEIINLNDPVPTWRYTGTMANARRQANATLLPDGTVLVTGGSSNTGFDDYTHPVYPAELWNPATGTWSTMASLSVYRGYHSVATLLPDGRVLSAGGECSTNPPCDRHSAEIFSPPYLFKGTRPTISSAPASIAGGQTFFVGTPDAANITQVTWIRFGAVTHTFNQEQRISFLGFSQATGGLNVTAPPSANLAPPGFYMLFLLNGSGIPSVASIIHVDNSSFATTTTVLTSSPNPSNYGESVTFTGVVQSTTTGTPTGTVTFMDGPNTIGTATLATGSGQFTTSTLAAGTHSITAVYSGDSNFLSSTSPILTQTVNQGVTTTTTTMTATPNPSQYYQTVVLKATVTSAAGTIPTGNVTFKDGISTIVTVALTSGTATLSVTTLAVGVHSLTAGYAGGTNFTASTSPAVTQTVNKAQTTTTLTSTPNPSTSGQAVTFTATVAGEFGGSPSATVTFKDGTTTIGSSTVSITTHQAQLVTSTLSVGTHNITATYNDSTSFTASTSPVVTQTVN